MQTEKSVSPELSSLREELQQIKDRINLFETTLDIQKWKESRTLEPNLKQTDDEFDLKFTSNSDDSIEFRIGEYGMAWLGNIVLLFGMAFLVQYLQNSGYPAVSAMIGFISVAGIYAVSYFTRTSYSFLSKLFAYNGHLLLFFITLRLHFFQAEPLIGNKTAGFLVLCIVPGVLFYLAFLRKSQLMSGMVLLMILISGIVSNSVHILPVMTIISAMLAVLLYQKYGWLKLVFMVIFLVYLTLLNWLLNNPLIGNKPEFITSPGISYMYLFANGFIFSLLAFIPKKEHVSNDFIITSVVWNGLGFSAILALFFATNLHDKYVPVFTAIAVSCLAFAIILQARAPLKITASMYALYSFLAMSVAFYGIVQLPKAYLLLSLQSLLVVSMALWFGSRFIVIMNTILFALLLGFYLADQASSNTINFSFMFVALITARVINWKKERLKIKTELIRNLYLIFGFTMTLVAFYHAFPASYITVSWIFAAILFFIMSRLINNIKYRWLTIAALVASAIKLIFVDLSDIDIGFRVLVFLLLAIISITVSILYTKYLIKKKE
jgi:hypothetical protein